MSRSGQVGRLVSKLQLPAEGACNGLVALNLIGSVIIYICDSDVIVSTRGLHTFCLVLCHSLYVTRARLLFVASRSFTFLKQMNILAAFATKVIAQFWTHCSLQTLDALLPVRPTRKIHDDGARRDHRFQKISFDSFVECLNLIASFERERIDAHAYTLTVTFADKQLYTNTDVPVYGNPTREQECELLNLSDFFEMERIDDDNTKTTFTGKQIYINPDVPGYSKPIQEQKH